MATIERATHDSRERFNRHDRISPRRASGFVDEEPGTRRRMEDPALPLRIPRGLVAVAASVTVVAAAGFGAGPATAATGRVPIETESFTTQQSPPPAEVAALRAALEALPNSATVHVSEIVEEYARGSLG